MSLAAGCYRLRFTRFQRKAGVLAPTITSVSVPSESNPRPVHKAGRCVVWSPAGTPEDPNLTHALHRPNLDVRAAHDDLSVIAAVLDGLATRDLSKPEPRIVLCIEPHRLNGLAECLEVLSTYVQELTLWVFDPSRSDVLRKVSVAELLSLRAVPARRAEPVVEAQPAPKPKIDVHPMSPQRSIDVTTGPTLNIATGQTAWVGPWGGGADDADKADTKHADKPAETDSKRTETWSPAHKLRLTGGEAEAPAADAPSAPPAPLPPPIPVASSVPTPVPSNLQPTEPPSQEPLLTDEELAMLLGDDPRFSGQS